VSEAGHRCRLYLVSPPAIDLPKFIAQVEDAFAGGDVGCLQLRLKDVPEAEILKAADKLLPLCAKHGVAFIINDSPKIAKQCGADGVHLGQDDGSVAEARALLGEDKVIGVSCHDSKHLAMEAGERGADYVAFGAFYPTTSKNPESLARWGTPKPEILAWWQEYMVLPCVAIGGINPSNCGVLAASGADFVAAITAVWNNPEGASKAVAAFNKSIEEAKA